MSKGHGATQRAILDALTTDWTEVLRLADRISDPFGDTNATRATEESVRRATKRLAAEGLVELRQMSGDYTGTGRRRLLHARLVP